MPRQRILHAKLDIPVRPGPLTLYYPKWMPADHSPDGPIPNVAGLKFSAGGKEIAWVQDDVDMYAFNLDVPPGVNSIQASLDFLISAPGPTIDFAASGSAKLFILMWNQVILYPKGLARCEIELSTLAHCAGRMEIQHFPSHRQPVRGHNHILTCPARSAR